MSGPAAVETKAAEDSGDRLANEPARTEAPAEESTDWVSKVRLNETKLKGNYGEYKISGSFVPGKLLQWAYQCEIEMKPSSKAKSEGIAWVQVVRRHDTFTDDWAKTREQQGIDGERAKRTDPKTGFRIDRKDATKQKSPFYGLDKKTGGLETSSRNARTGKYGGENPWMRDTPDVFDNDQLEFITTATDMEKGIQFDAIQWGVTFNKAQNVAAPDTPRLIAGGGSQLAGRDRAIDLWNREIANGEIDKLPTTSNPAATARALSGMITGKDAAKVIDTLSKITDPDLRKRVVACYREETDRELRHDLQTVLSSADQKKLEAWR